MQSRIGSWQLALVSLGSVIGSGWLFSPFYGLQAAGGAVLLAWLLAALLSLLICLTFARMCKAFPLVGGTYRLLGITHPGSTSRLFLIVGWLSFVVLLPLEAQSVVQYLGFWFPRLLHHAPGGEVDLSWSGLAVAVVVGLCVTWFNTLHISRVAQANALVSVWKLLIPLLLALVVIIGFGSMEQFGRYWNRGMLDFEPAMQAVVGSGLVFAFTGFQNGLMLANQARDPQRAVPYSLYLPLLLGLLLYLLLSISYMASMPGEGRELASAAAPLLGLLSVLGLSLLTPVLLADAVVSPLGTANAYVAASGRILYAFGYEVRPGSLLTRLNRHGSPALALWVNAAVGLLFLLPFPTWKQLVSLMSSMMVFTFASAPVSLGALAAMRRPAGELPARLSPTSGLRAQCVGVAGFLGCTWMVYWSGAHNLALLWATLALAMVAHGWLEARFAGIRDALRENLHMLMLVAGLWLLAWLRQRDLLAFPWDNVLAAAAGLAAYAVFVGARLEAAQIDRNVDRADSERRGDAMRAAAT